MWDSTPGYFVAGAADIPFPDHFDLWEHLFENQSPFCGFAFPRSCVVDMGLRFDETLPVVEDWDLIMQVALLCGVANTSEVTALYRRWESQHSSLATHSADEWHRARDKVLARIDQHVIPLPPGALSDFHRLYDELQMRRKMVDHLVFERNTARDEASERAKSIETLQGNLHEVRIERNISMEQADATQQELDRIRLSLSWKLTKPVRAVRALLSRSRSS